MAAFIKAIYNSGIIGNYMRGVYAVKPDNTVERVACLRKLENGTCSFHDQASLVTNMNHVTLFGSSGKPIPFFTLEQNAMKTVLLGGADEGVVYIQYWYTGQKYILYFNIPDEDITFPMYESVQLDNQPDLMDDSDCITNVHLVQILINDDDNEDDDDDEDDNNPKIDITDVVQPFIGPKNDFHGRLRDGILDFRYILDYLMQNNKSPCFSSIFSGNLRKTVVQLTYADMHKTTVCVL